MLVCNSTARADIKNFALHSISHLSTCIKDCINSINHVLDERGKSSFKLLYSPSVVNLLSVMSVFKGAEKGPFGKVSCDLSDKRLLMEDVRSLIGCL